jgi:uncharacterized protein
MTLIGINYKQTFAMPEVVSNTTPLLTLLGIEALELLHQLYGDILVPAGVWQELEKGRERGVYADLTQLDWIDIRPVQNQTALAYLMTELDRGEAETLVLAQETRARLVLLDEKAARRVADQLSMTYTGSLGILLRAKDQNLITAVKPLLDRMRQNGIWIGDSLYQSILTTAKEE